MSGLKFLGELLKFRGRPDPKGRRICFDIEATNLLNADSIDYSQAPFARKASFFIHCIAAVDIDTQERWDWVQDDCVNFRTFLQKEKIRSIIGHNIINYDLLALKVLIGLDYDVLGGTLEGKPVHFVDTLVLSKTLNPDRKGHSIGYFGELLGLEKIDYRQRALELGIIEPRAPRGAEFAAYHPEMTAYCLTPDHKVLNESLEWVEIGRLANGDRILGFDEHGPNRKWRTATVENCSRVSVPVFEVALKSGKKFKATEDHQWLVSQSRGKGRAGVGAYKWVKTKDLRTGSYSSKLPKVLDEWDEIKTKEAGWLQGMYDGEGSLAKNRFDVVIAQRPTMLLERLKKELTGMGVAYTSRTGSVASDCCELRLTGAMRDRLKFLGQIRPERLLSKVKFEDLGRFENKGGVDEVVSVKPLGIQEVVELQTDVRTYVCEGFPMHNCHRDVDVNVKVFHYLMREWGIWDWLDAFTLETIVADIITRQSHRGFWFDQQLAVENVRELDKLMEEARVIVEPHIPPKKPTQADMKAFQPPKIQLKKDGSLSAGIIKWAEKHGGKAFEEDENLPARIEVFGKVHRLPMPTESLLTEVPAKIDDTTHIKGWFVEMGWQPTAWKERDLTVDSKKQKLSTVPEGDKPSKFQQTVERYIEQTMDSPFCWYRMERLKDVIRPFKKLPVQWLIDNPYAVRDALLEMGTEKGIKVFTNPQISVGQDKELCPALERIQDRFAHTKDITNYLTYKHRRNSILGGGFDPDEDEEPDKGFLAKMRDDGRIATPADSCGCNTSRMKHREVANIPRVSSLFGGNMRAMFGVDGLMVQMGYDGSSLEARIEAHYCWPHEGRDKTYCLSLPMEKPNDVHTMTAKRIGELLGQPFLRDHAKSVKYCVPMTTQALTRKGWKHYDEIEVGDEVLGYDQASRTKKWTKVTDKVYFEEAEVFELSTKWLKVQATADHRWFVKQRKEGCNSIRRGVEEVRTTAQLTSESSIIMNAPMDDEEDLLPSKGLLSQEKYGYSWSERVLAMSQRERQAFLEGFMVADGHKAVGGWSWAQNDGEIQEAAILASYLVHDGVVAIRKVAKTKTPMKSVLLSQKSHRGLQTAKKESKGVQPVWCLTTELGSWVMRQDDTITITGNCLAYGGQVPKVAKIVGCSVEQAQEIFDAYWQVAEPLAKLKKALSQEWKSEVNLKRFIRGIDGRKIPTRSEHALINAAFQSAGVICMKLAMIIHELKLRELGLGVDFWTEDWKNKSYAQQLVAYHDECQFEMTPDLVKWKSFATEEDAKAFLKANKTWYGVKEAKGRFFCGYSIVGELAVQAVEEAGKTYKLNVDLGAEYALGKTWRDCH